VDSIEGGGVGWGGERVEGWDGRIKNRQQRTVCFYSCEVIVHFFFGCFSLVLLGLAGYFLVSFCIRVCSLHILWRLC
jgi:hypothetical protein